jgi:Holliday junction resolvasome RuvABC endonuclease subunit
MNILSLDIATHCGWATKTASGVWDLSIKRDESSGMRLIRFKSKVKEIIEKEQINLVTFERSAGFHKNAIIVQSELHGVLKLYLEEIKMDYRAYSAKEIKKFATGNGNANKEKMIQAARDRYKIEPIDDNHADALHIYHLSVQDLSL